MNTHTVVLLGVLMILHSTAMATPEKPTEGSQADAGGRKPTPQEIAKPTEVPSPKLKNEVNKVTPKKSANKASSKKEIKLNLCDQ